MFLEGEVGGLGGNADWVGWMRDRAVPCSFLDFIDYFRMVSCLLFMEFLFLLQDPCSFAT